MLVLRQRSARSWANSLRPSTNSEAAVAASEWAWQKRLRRLASLLATDWLGAPALYRALGRSCLIGACLVTAGGMLLWLWDYHSDPIACAINGPIGAIYIAALVFGGRPGCAAIAAFATLWGWEAWFLLGILPRFQGGLAPGPDAFLYFALMPLVMTRCLPVTINVVLLVGAAGLPPLLMLMGLAPGFPVATFLVVFLPAAAISMTSVAAFNRSWHATAEQQRLLVLREQAFFSLAEHCPDNIHRCDADARLIYMNPAAMRSHDLTHALGKAPLETYPGPAGEALLGDYDRTMRQVLASGEPAQMDLIFPNRAGEMRVTQIRLAAERDANGRISGVVAFGRDVTDQRVMERSLREAVEAGEVANQAKAQFLATMSHELRTPLNAVIGFSEMMMTELFGPLGHQNYAGYAGAIHDSGRHLLDLIDDVLDMSKIEAGKYQIQPMRVDVPSLIADCLLQVSVRAEEAGITLVRHLTGEPMELWADQRALRQILINLLSNAVKFTGEGGTISVAVEPRPGQVAISVTDTGIGIPAARLPRITQPFETSESSYIAGPRGTGLGLPITKSLVELHGGKLEISSREGAGTTVTVSLPQKSTTLAAHA